MKHFESWNQEKQQLEERKNEDLPCKRRQIWLCKIGENLGGESSKNDSFIQPVLILHAHFGWDLVLVLPLTTKYKEKLKHFLFQIDSTDLDQTSYAMLNQIKVISKKRLLRKIVESIDESDFDLILKKFQFLMTRPLRSSDT